jgi:soluble lytic murein transglycosylase-like protein
MFFALAPDAEATHHTKLARAEARVSALRTQLAAERRLHRARVMQIRGTSRSARNVNHALTIAAATYGVPVTKLRRVARCESTLDPNARNGRYLGLFQFGTPLWSTTPYRRFSRTDPYAAAAAAAWAFKRGMARHWPVCGR